MGQKDLRYGQSKATSGALNQYQGYFWVCYRYVPENTNARTGRERPHRPKAISKRNLEFGRNVTVGWHVAVDFKADADFN
jgi:hypothetical protein